MTELSPYTESGDLALFDFEENHHAAKHIADLPLESAHVTELTKRARELAEAKNLLLPDADALLERCVVALLGGHIVLQGPPGTGKTTLAYVLAEAFNATAHLETATADWSTYDVIGGLHPKPRGGMESLEPWLGHVPRAALRCASVIAKHEDEEEGKNEPHQAHWLIIDEFNRAEIDKAIGPLFTVLGDGGADKPLPLWFGANKATDAVWLPKRFRILATMNSVDANYVNTLSQGLIRRFQFVYVGVPTKDQIPAELEGARRNAAEWYREIYGGNNFDVTGFVNNELVGHATKLVAEFLEAIRYDDSKDATRPGWPLGTAQMVDVYRQLALRMATTPTDVDVLSAVDRALADRVVPQAGDLRAAQLDAVESWLSNHDFKHATTALRHVRAASATGY